MDPYTDVVSWYIRQWQHCNYYFVLFHQIYLHCTLLCSYQPDLLYDSCYCTPKSRTKLEVVCCVGPSMKDQQLIFNINMANLENVFITNSVKFRDCTMNDLLINYQLQTQHRAQ